MNKRTPSFASLAKEFSFLFIVRKVKEANGLLASQLLQLRSRDLHFGTFAFFVEKEKFAAASCALSFLRMYLRVRNVNVTVTFIIT